MSKKNKNIETYFENLSQKYYVIAAMLNDVKTFIIHNYLDNLHMEEKIKPDINLVCLNSKNILINYTYLNFLKEFFYSNKKYKNIFSEREKKLIDLIKLTLEKTTDLLNNFSQTLTKDIANYSKSISINLFCKYKINNNNEEAFYIAGQLYSLKDLVIHYAINNTYLFEKILKHTYYEFCALRYDKTICEEEGLKGFAYLAFITGINKSIDFKYPKNLPNLNNLLQKFIYTEQHYVKPLEKEFF